MYNCTLQSWCRRGRGRNVTSLFHGLGFSEYLFCFDLVFEIRLNVTCSVPIIHVIYMYIYIYCVGGVYVQRYIVNVHVHALSVDNDVGMYSEEVTCTGSVYYTNALHSIVSYLALHSMVLVYSEVILGKAYLYMLIFIHYMYMYVHVFCSHLLFSSCNGRGPTRVGPCEIFCPLLSLYLLHVCSLPTLPFHPVPLPLRAGMAVLLGIRR